MFTESVRKTVPGNGAEHWEWKSDYPEVRDS
jgi:hypothetical protein